MTEPIFPEWTVEKPVDEIIGEAIGAASTCWENLEDTGVFNSTMAAQICDELMSILKKKMWIE